MTPVERIPRVLIVDDALSNVAVLAEQLKDDYDVRVATRGEEALDLALSPETPDIVLLDIIMPGMDGHEVCRRLKATPSTRNIPVIFITAKSEVEDEARGLELGAVDYIVKPFNLAIVKARVKTHLELKRRGDILENLSMLDGLTGIPNRRRFDEHLERSWRASLRDHEWLSVLMADIDHFKCYNDQCGHLAGDETLRRVAKAIRESCQRPGDLAARYGGEEFACVLPDTDLAGAMHLAERLRRSVADLAIVGDQAPDQRPVTISIGVATTRPKAGGSPTDLLNAADRLLYQAKASGRDRVVGMEI